MPRRTTLIALMAFVAVAAILFVPWLTKKRDIVASTPVPQALFGVKPVPLKHGQRACMNQVTLDPLSQIAEIGVMTSKKPGPPLDVVATGPGYRSTARVPAGYTDSPALYFNLTPPPHALIGQICFRNSGRSAMSLDGTDEFRTNGRPTLTIDGAPQSLDAQLKLYGRNHESYLSQAGTIFRRAATFTPGFLPRVVLALLAFLALVAIPAGVFRALAIAARDHDG
jgi:hypothetical protein